MIEPIRVTETLKPVKITEPEPGMFIFDMGQNLVGWCRLKVQGKPGTTVKLRHAESLKEDGTLYLDNIRGAKVTDLYTLKGEGTETYEPRFTYHGFRYVEVTGFPGKPTLDTLEGCVVHDDMEVAGSFTCSHPLINRIYRNIVWGVRGNYRSIPTDCPQRDERQGWLGDRSVESRGETFLYRNASLYAKWVQDMADAQKESGSVPDVCPAYWAFYNDNVTWPSSYVIIPGMLYDQYGDLQPIQKAYPGMVKWIDHMSQFITEDNIMPRDTYGDWCVPPEDPKLIHSQDPARKTAGPILGTTYFYHCLTLMARYATLLDKPDDANRCKELAGRLKLGLNQKYYKANLGQYDNGAQTTSVLPLAFNMVPSRPASARLRPPHSQDHRGDERPCRHGPRRWPVAQPRSDRRWTRRPLLRLRHQHDLPELGLHGRKRRHHDLGTLERQHRRPGHEFRQPRHARWRPRHLALRMRRRNPIRPSPARFQAHPHASPSRRRPQMGQSLPQQPLRSHRQRLGNQRVKIPLERIHSTRNLGNRLGTRSRRCGSDGVGQANHRSQRIESSPTGPRCSRAGGRLRDLSL